MNVRQSFTKDKMFNGYILETLSGKSIIIVSEKMLKLYKGDWEMKDNTVVVDDTLFSILESAMIK